MSVAPDGLLAAPGLGALLSRGTGGLAAGAPIDSAALTPPRSPNWCLAAPAWHQGAQQIAVPAVAAEAGAAWTTLRALGGGFPRSFLHAEWPERRSVQWVVRSALLNFPDLVTGAIVADPGGTGLYLYSRSLFGESDLGVNRRRIEAWLAAFQAALPAP